MRRLYVVPMAVVLTSSALYGLSTTTPRVTEACDNCQEGCPLGHDGIWITQSGTGNEILTWGFGQNKCIFDIETCCELIACPDSTGNPPPGCGEFLDPIEDELKTARTEDEVVRYMKSTGVAFKLVPDTRSVVVYGCKGAIVAYLPTSAVLTKAVAFAPEIRPVVRNSITKPSPAVSPLEQQREPPHKRGSR